MASTVRGTKTELKVGKKKVTRDISKKSRRKYCHLEGECELAGSSKNSRFCAPCGLYRY